jgi:hypothetical protein
MKPFATLARLARRTGVLALSAIAVAAVLVSAGPARASVSDPFVTGYVWSNLASPSGCYAPSATYSYNSRTQGQLNNTICHVGVGSYVVHFPGLQSSGGNVQVTAYGSNLANCKVAYWVSTSTEEQVGVVCYSLAGVSQDNLFVASFASGRDGSAGLFDFVWADQPTASSYIPSTVYSEDNNYSLGQSVTITRSGTGSYTVSFPVFSGPVAAGSVKVTAYGSGSGVCKVGSWGPSGGNELVGVQCYSASGAPSDEYFSMVFASGMNVLGDNTLAEAYAWADQPSSSSYTPSLQYQRDTVGSKIGTITISRAGVGTYDVAMPFQNIGLDGGHVQVTAYGSGTNRCQIRNWSSNSSGRTARILCYTSTGTMADSFFAMVYVGRSD